MLTFEYLCEHTVPKAGALALLQRTAARKQREKSDPAAKQTRGGEREKGHREGSSGSKVSGQTVIRQSTASGFPLNFLTLAHENL